MTPPKRIYLELNNVPPCNFGALWYDAEVYPWLEERARAGQPAGENCAAYVLESEAQAEIEQLRSRIAALEQKEAA